MLCRRLLLLKPLRPGLSGYARLQWEGGRTEMQIQLRGLPGGGARFFWYDGQPRELGQAQANPRGEACLTASLGDNLLSPKGMQALLILSAATAPEPLLLGLPGPADGGTLLELRAAALALCQRLTPKAATKPPMEAARTQPKSGDAVGRAQYDGSADAGQARRNVNNTGSSPSIGPADAGRNQHDGSTDAGQAQRNADDIGSSPSIGSADAGRNQCDGSTDVEQVPYKSSTNAGRSRRNRSARLQHTPHPAPNRPELPREIFLPAIDPAPYMAARERPPEKIRPQRPWADALPNLRWPEGFESLRPFFAAGMPCALLDAPGWRFVRASDAGGPDDLFLGLFARDGAVRQLAYAHPATHPPTPAFRPAIGLDGRKYQVLWQQVG